MKSRVRILLLLPLALLFSCSSTQLVRFEVQEPAKISLPLDIANVVIVNNAVVQPSDMGVSRTYTGGKGEYVMSPLNFDSLAWYTVEVLGSIIDQNRFFDEVSIFNENARSDSAWLSTVELPVDFRREIFDEDDFDGIISIDRIVFNVNHQVKNNGSSSVTELTVFVDTKIDIHASCSMYLYNRESALTSFAFTDSITYKSSLIGSPGLIFTDIPQVMLEELAMRAGEELANYFIPLWTIETRLFYYESSRMREAFSYFNNRKWDEAEVILIPEYEESRREGTKAKLANNIAIVKEAQDQYTEALQWAEQAAQHLANTNNPDEKDKNVIDSHIQQLRKRIADNMKLDLQFGM